MAISNDQDEISENSKNIVRMETELKEYRKEDWKKIQGSPYIVMSTVYEVYNHGTLGSKVKLPAVTKKVAEGAFSDCNNSIKIIH